MMEHTPDRLSGGKASRVGWHPGSAVAARMQRRSRPRQIYTPVANGEDQASIRGSDLQVLRWGLSFSLIFLKSRSRFGV